MDAQIVQPDGKLTTGLLKSRDRLRSAHGAIIVAAEEWGLRKGHPEWHFVSSLIDTQASIADLVVAFGDEMDMIIAEHRKAAKDEFARQYVARDETKFMITQARGAIRDFDIEKARMANDMLERAVPLLAEGVRQAVAVRHVWVARGKMLQQALIVAAITVALLVGGYSWRTVQVWNVSDTALRATEGIDDCKANSHWVDPQGHRLCRLDAFTAREADAK